MKTEVLTRPKAPKADSTAAPQAISGVIPRRIPAQVALPKLAASTKPEPEALPDALPTPAPALPEITPKQQSQEQSTRTIQRPRRTWD